MDNLPPESREETPMKIVKKAWYQTGWVWFWLIFVWPVGVYGLIQRAEPEHRKWWWGGVAALFIISLFNEPVDDSSASNETTSTSKKDYERDALIYCKIAVEDRATYGVKVPFSGAKVFPNVNGGNRFRVLMDIELKNQYGVWGKGKASCYVENNIVTELVVNGQTIL